MFFGSVLICNQDNQDIIMNTFAKVVNLVQMVSVSLAVSLLLNTSLSVTLVGELGVFGTLHSFLEAKSRARMHAGSGSCTALEDGMKEHMEVAYAKGCPPPVGSEMEEIFTAPLDRALTNENVLAIAEQIAKGLLHLSQLSVS